MQIAPERCAEPGPVAQGSSTWLKSTTPNLDSLIVTRRSDHPGTQSTLLLPQPLETHLMATRSLLVSASEGKRWVSAEVNDAEWFSCVPVSRDKNSFHGGMDQFRGVDVEAPAIPKQQRHSPPTIFELPGSLLLPSQGFSQLYPPATPTRPIFLNQDPNETDVASTPSLSTPSSDSEADDMDFLRSLAPPSRRMTQTHTRGRGNSAAHPVIPTKPFTAMSVEELLQCLPKLSSDVIANHWIPAMEQKLLEIKIMLKQATEIDHTSQKHLEQIDKVGAPHPSRDVLILLS